MAAKNKYIASIVLDGENEFKNAVTACNKKITSMRSELSLAKEKYAENANSLQALKEKHEILSKTLQLQKEKLEATREGYNNAEKSRAKLSSGLQILKNDYQTATEKLDKMKQSGSATDEELEKQQRNVDDLAAAIKRGEKNYQTAENRVDSWKNKLNTAETQMVRSNRALKTNDTYLEEARKSTNKCADSIDKFGKKVKTSDVQVRNFGDGLKTHLKSEAIISGVSALGNGIRRIGESAVDATKEVALYADDINTLSTQTGVATDTLQELKYMEDLVDVSLETVTKSMARNIKSMSKAKEGSDTYAKVYKKLGVSITDSNGKLKDSEEVYWQVIDALGKVENETERNADSMTLFGKSAQDLNPLISQGIAGIDELKQEAKDMGAVLDQDTLASMNSVNDVMDRLTQQSNALKREFGVNLAPSIMSASLEIGEAIQENKEELIDFASDGIDAVTIGLSWIINHAQGVASGVLAIAGAYATLKAVSNVSSAVSGIASIASLANPIGATVAVIGLLATAIVSLKAATAGNNAETNKEIIAYEKARTAIEEKNKSIREGIQETESNLENTKEEVAANDNLIAKLISLNEVENKTAGQKQQLKGIVDSLKEDIPELADAYDKETDSVDLSREAILKLADAYKENAIAQGMQKQLQAATEAAAEAEVNLTKAEQERTKVINKKKEATSEYEKIRQKADKAEKEFSETGIKGKGYDELQEKLQKAADKVYSLNNEEKKYNSTIKKAKKTRDDANKTVDQTINFYDKYKNKLEKNNKEQSRNTNNAKNTVSAYEKLVSAYEKAEKSYESYGIKTSKSTKSTFKSAVDMAKKTGTEVPSGLIKGLKRGDKSLKSATKQMNNAVCETLVGLADEARGVGISVPAEITDGLKKGTMDASKAYKLLNSAIKKEGKNQQSTLEKMNIIVPKTMKKAFEKGGDGALEAIRESKSTIKKLQKSAGVSSVDGLVEGIEQEKPRVIKAMENLAKDSSNAFKVKLKIKSPSREFKSHGENTVLGLIWGVDELKGKLRKKMLELGAVQDEAYRDEMEIKSPSRKMEKNGKYTVDGLIKGMQQELNAAEKSLKNATKKMQKQAKDEIQRQNKLVQSAQNKIDTKNVNEKKQVQIWKKVVAQTKNGTDAHVKALKKYVKSLKQLQKDTKSIQKDFKDNFNSTINDLKAKTSDYKSQIEELKSTYAESVASTQSSISTSWGMFSKASVSKTNNADGLIRNMKTQADTVAEYQKNMQKLRNSGLSDSIIKQLEEAGISSAGDVATLAQMNKQQLEEYQKYFNVRENYAKKEALSVNKALNSSTNAQISSLQKKMTNLQKSYAKKISSLEKKYKKQMKNLGLSASKGFVSGIEKGNQDVYKAIAKMTGQTVKQVKKNLKINSPSRVMDELGNYTGTGFANGLVRSTKNLANVITDSLPKKVSSTEVQTVTGSQEVASSSGNVQLNMYLDSQVVASASFRSIDLMQGADIQLKRRGLAR